MTYSKLVCLPIEYSARELDSKALLTYQLVKSGWSVIIGQQWEIFNQLSQIPPAYIVFKGQNKLHQGTMLAAKKMNHFIISAEEEALGIIDENTLNKSSTHDIYNLADVIFTNGEFEREFHEKRSENKINIKSVGNPRIDLLKREYRYLFNNKINKIKEEFGQYVLLNTNFALMHSFMGNINHIRREHIRSQYIKDKQGEDEFNEYFEWELECHNEIKKIIDKLTKAWPNVNFIIRPHPGESLDKAKASYPNYNNLKVIKDGSHLPWTLGSELLIHTSCTTGLEAEIAGKNAISVVPREIWYSKQILSNKINSVFNSADTAIDYVSSLFLGKAQKSHSKLSNFKNIIQNIDAENASKNMVNFFNSTNHSNESFSFQMKQPMQRQEFQIEKCSVSQYEFQKFIGELYINDKNLSSEKKPSITIMTDSLFFVKPS